MTGCPSPSRIVDIDIEISGYRWPRRHRKEGADIIAFDSCADVPAVDYSMATESDLDETGTFQSLNILPVPWIEPVDVSNMLVWLASDEARYVTGALFAVDAGCTAR